VIIAVDGPSAAGKSTVAKLLAAGLGIDYIDTGAMYRAVALKALRTGLDQDDEKALVTFLAETDIDLAGSKILLDGEDVTNLIRTNEISMKASLISAIPAVREKLVALQRSIGARKSVVMDGRDIGSNVFPNADYKFFITASPEIRAERRRRELADRGEDVPFEDLLRDTNKRDKDDSTRALNPLVMTEDAILIVTDELNIEEALGEVLKYIQ
jgi:cytidylate kinase